MRRPGEYFPRTSGLRVRYDNRADVRRGDGDRTGRPRARLRAIDIGGSDERLFSLTCPLMLGTIPWPSEIHERQARSRAEKQVGAPLTSRVEARCARKFGLLARAAGHRGQEQHCHAARWRRHGNQGVASDHGLSAQRRSRPRASCRRSRSTSAQPKCGRGKPQTPVEHKNDPRLGHGC